MLKRYSIWDKTSNVICPAGTVYTAEQWKEMYPVAAIDGVTIVGSKGIINGGYFGVLSSMIDGYEAQGCDFSECVTDEDYLEAIEAFEDSQSAPSSDPESTPEERMASSLEILALNAMETVNPDDPDEE